MKKKIERKLTWISQQIGVDNRETETNRSNKSPKSDKEREDREVRENIRIMSKFSSYFVSKF